MSEKNQLVVRAANFQLITRQPYKMGPNEIMHRYVLLHEQETILDEAHVGIARGHYQGRATTRKILGTRLWWSTMHDYAVDYAKICDVCQRIKKPS